MGPAVIPSGGEEVRVLYSWKRRLEAIELAMICVSRLARKVVAETWRGKNEELADAICWIDCTTKVT